MGFGVRKYDSGTPVWDLALAGTTVVRLCGILVLAGTTVVLLCGIWYSQVRQWYSFVGFGTRRYGCGTPASVTRSPPEAHLVDASPFAQDSHKRYINKILMVWRLPFSSLEAFLEVP